ncbi:MAG: protein phosphatase CheZ [Thauera sp.]|nr:protein phosphatase CheZ [Thauera sp.]
MSKKSRADEAGDSDELQALFDSIAGQDAPAPVTAAAVPAAAAAAPLDESGDSDQLQALFDSVAADRQQQAPAVSAGTEDEESDRSVFNRLGKMTRQLHDALRELGLDESLKEAARSIPDTRERLDYIAQLTEQAASRVLNATDIAKPLQDAIKDDAQGLNARWGEAFDGKLTTDSFRQLSVETRDFLGRVERESTATSEQLIEIMLAQDFQDLTGQVIKRVLHAAQSLETQLLQVLLETAPPELVAERNEGLMNGPVVKAGAGAEVVTSQAQVDDLLESLGF